MPDDTNGKGPDEKNSKRPDNSALSRRNILLAGTSLAAATAIKTVDRTQVAQAQPILPPQATAPSGKKANILVIFGDDVGQTNISAYSFGVVGYKTPNIDRIAKEGMMFTDYYAENSCTAGRSTFITGQACLRTGLSKVGAPGAPVGLQKGDITIAQALKPLGYATGQFGKNHLGDRDEYLPTNHGFDEFFGNLYHLNAEEEPEQPYWPKDDPEFLKAYNPRGVIRSVCRRQDRGHRAAEQEADGDDRRRDVGRRDRFHDAAGQGQQAVLYLDERHAHACLHACAAVDARAKRHGRE